MDKVSTKEKAILEWTGHPLVDVGIATVCAMAKNSDPRDLTLKDLDEVADEMAEYYFGGVMTAYNACVFTMNAYDNPTAGEDKRREYENRVLRAHRYPGDKGVSGLRCPFSGEPATHLIERRQMPMLTGEGILNFYPAGREGLPIAGPYLTAVQALPLGGRRAEGKLLIVHSDLPEMTLAFARRYLDDNRRILGLAKAGRLPSGDGPSLLLDREQGAWDTQKKRPKYPDAKSAGTLIASDLMNICQQAAGKGDERHHFSVTAYWLSNSGQGPSLEFFHLPSQVVRFLRLATMAPYGKRWKVVVARGWQDPRGKGSTESEETAGRGNKRSRAKSRESVAVPGGPGRSRNDILADLFSIYENGFVNLRSAVMFIRRHLLRKGTSFVRDSMKRQLGGMESGLRDPEAIDWELTSLFLKEVMGVDERYVSAVKRFADGLADCIDRNNDKPLFRSIVYSRRPWDLRSALTRAQRNQARERNELLFGVEDYLDVFEAEEAVGKSDWSLARDLVSIRLVEELHRRGFFEKAENKELLIDSEEVAAEMG